jgi:uncharacterized protein YfaS (alpha-2-macroglobulin family)
LRARTVLLLILSFSMLTIISSAVASPGLGISVQVNRPWYYIGENINVYGVVLSDDAPLVSANVALEIHDPAGSPVITRSLQTNSSGIFSLVFSFPMESLTGSYVAYVSCTYNGQTALNSTSFQLKPPSALAVTIAAEKQLYNVGDNITIAGSVMLSSIKQPQVLVALEVQNPHATPIIVRVLETDSQGNYNLTFPASQDSLVGNYSAFASATYNGSIARAETSFTLKPNISSVDINQDGKVNILDLAIVARAWGSYPGHPRWDPRCDVNGDGKINIMDITLVAKEYQL